jgi:glycosyltransferase involved in cell wall biosynthesis
MPSDKVPLVRRIAVTPSAARVAVLYISYDGLLEPLGESQVVSYLERLAADFDISVLSFEKPEDLDQRDRVAAMEQRLVEHGITWIMMRYHRHPPVLSTAWDVLRGVFRARRECRTKAVQVIHARSYVPSLMALGARGASRARFLFDMRGFWVDEKVEAGHWAPGSLLVRIGKYWERRFFRSADAIVSLTAQGVRTFATLGYIVPSSVAVEVIPTCVDLDRFRPADKDPQLLARLGLTGAPIVGCVGTMSNWYLRGEMLTYLGQLTRRFPDAQILIVTREDHESLRRDAEAAGVPLARLVLTQASFAEMPRMTSLFDAGVFFIRPALSKRGSAATKLAEFLACGVPVVINVGVGDSGAIVEHYRVGVVLASLDLLSMDQSCNALSDALHDSGMRARCRQVATELFDIDAGAARYRELYKRLTTSNREAVPPHQSP